MYCSRFIKRRLKPNTPFLVARGTLPFLAARALLAGQRLCGEVEIEFRWIWNLL